MYAIWSPASVTLPTATREGYIFSKWDIGAAGANYTPAANVTAVAQWTANKYNIVLNPNGGTVDNETENQTIAATYDENITLPTPERAGYTAG